jgi:hypothetical protein
MTFEQAARQVHEEQKPGWKNSKHADQWINTLRDYAFPKIGKRKVADLAAADFAEVLRPIWLAKPETASRVKQRCHAIMKWVWAHGLVKANPLDVVDHLLHPFRHTFEAGPLATGVRARDFPASRARGRTRLAPFAINKGRGQPARRYRTTLGRRH